MEKLNVGVVGCGTISGVYLRNCATLFPEIKIAAVSDLQHDRAAARASEFHIPKVYAIEQLLADDTIDAVLNLTLPLAHYDVTRAALKAGKAVYSEKPLAATLRQGEYLCRIAQRRGLALGCAPDTFLGAGIQTCRALIDAGAIGKPVGGTAFMVCGGHESWHPDPEFYYKKGGGPLFDMGPYYITALVALLGPVESVSGLAGKGFEERTITSAPKSGTRIRVDVPTHVSSLLEFASGASVVAVFSFDAPGGTSHTPIEIYGTKGTLQVPDPNTFGGPVRIRAESAPEWSDVPLRARYEDNSRGLGLADMGRAIGAGGSCRASGSLALHVLEIMHDIHLSAQTGKRLRINHSCECPEGMES
jgi:predicted dehydrogenase